MKLHINKQRSAIDYIDGTNKCKYDLWQNSA